MRLLPGQVGRAQGGRPNASRSPEYVHHVTIARPGRLALARGRIKMSSLSVRRIAGSVVAIAVVVLGIAAVARGVDGRSTVRGALKLEQVWGQPQMTPPVIAASIKKAGLTAIRPPNCSVAGKPVDNGAAARCFAQYMRIDALLVTGGRTYAQMPRYASADGKGTNVDAQAQRYPNGVAIENPARNVWITETALATALNTSYMAEQVSLFGIAVGAALILVGLALGGLALGGGRPPTRTFSGPPVVAGTVS